MLSILTSPSFGEGFASKWLLTIPFWKLKEYKRELFYRAVLISSKKGVEPFKALIIYATAPGGLDGIKRLREVNL